MSESGPRPTVSNQLTATEITMPFGAEPLIIGTGKLAKQANATVIAQVGGTVAMASVVMAGPRDVPIDFFPLTVDYREKAYAAGRMPGGYFKREGRPGEGEILRARLIDRPIRPMFPDNFRQEVQIYVTILSFDGVNSADCAALTASSAALLISDIPFETAVAAVRVGYDGTNFILNPTIDQQAASKLDLIVAGTKKAITMVESGAQMLTEEQMLGALRFGHAAVVTLCEEQDKLRAQVGKPKAAYNVAKHDETLVAKIREIGAPGFDAVSKIHGKSERTDALKALKTTIAEQLVEKYPDVKDTLKTVFEEEYSRVMREAVLTTGIRADGRALDEIRHIASETSVLPRTHGSAVFTRGQTQSLGVLTLGTGEDTQGVDDLEEVSERTFYLHYNFPSYSVGEVKRIMGPGRREIGHGALATRSILPVIPDHDKFPYTIRLVSEILESNGSSSMASVCSGILALMDGGVPIKAPVAGIAMGLILEGDRYAVLSDIMGLEDHLGDMDFKVAGTEDGITALQMDIKIEGVTIEIMEKALEQAKAGRIHILGKMKEALSESRTALSPFAPQIKSITINPERIRDVIGSGGKTIKDIVAKTGCKIDVQDDGTVTIASSDGTAMERAIKWIRDLTAEAEMGKVYTGKVTRIAEFGAFIEILPGKDGLVHISELENRRVDRVEDVCRLGDEVLVKVIGIDEKGKVRLSRKQAMNPDEVPEGDGPEAGSRRAPTPDAGGDRSPRGGGGGGDRDRGGDRGPRGGGGAGGGARGGRGGESRGPNGGGGSDRGPRPGGQGGGGSRSQGGFERGSEQIREAAPKPISDNTDDTGRQNLAGVDPFQRRFDDSLDAPPAGGGRFTEDVEDDLNR